MTQPHTGLCYPMSEQGSEGTYWIIQDNWHGPHWSYDDMEGLENGDFLLIKNQWDLIEWAGHIDKDSVDYRSQQHGTVHWVQRGIDPELWCSYFTHHDPTRRPNIPYYTGILIKNAKAVERKKRALEASASRT